MDQIAIGKFIADMRKKQNMTQRQLADKLSISDKTISKWECGKGFPEISLVMPLCEILQINANELLSAQRLSNADYQKKAEENLVKLIKENAENKKNFILSLVVGSLCIVAVLALVSLASFLNIPVVARIVLILLAIIIGVIGVGAAIVLDSQAGTFECPFCHEQFVPLIPDYIKGLHTFKKRRLTCPKCGKTGMCRHRITKK